MGVLNLNARFAGEDMGFKESEYLERFEPKPALAIIGRAGSLSQATFMLESADEPTVGIIYSSLLPALTFSYSTPIILSGSACYLEEEHRQEERISMNQRMGRWESAAFEPLEGRSPLLALVCADVFCFTGTSAVHTAIILASQDWVHATTVLTRFSLALLEM